MSEPLWITRSEYVTWDEFRKGLKQANLVPERICHNISNPPGGFLCSVCKWGDFAEPSHLLSNVNYCPNCGAKVLRNVTVSNLHTAKIEIRHGDHPPYPLFEGDAWTAWFVCSKCEGAVDLNDKYCKHCGAKLEPYERIENDV